MRTPQETLKIWRIWAKQKRIWSVEAEAKAAKMIADDPSFLTGRPLMELSGWRFV